MTCKTFTVKPATAISLKQMSYSVCEYHSDNTDTRNGGLHLQAMPAVTLAYLVTTSTSKMLLNQPDNALQQMEKGLLSTCNYCRENHTIKRPPHAVVIFTFLSPKDACKCY